MSKIEACTAHHCHVACCSLMRWRLQQLLARRRYWLSISASLYLPSCLCQPAAAHLGWLIFSAIVVNLATAAAAAGRRLCVDLLVDCTYSDRCDTHRASWLSGLRSGNTISGEWLMMANDACLLCFWWCDTVVVIRWFMTSCVKWRHAQVQPTGVSVLM